MRAWSLRRPATAPARTALQARPFGPYPTSESGKEPEGPGAPDAIEQAERFGHNLSNVIQRQILKPDGKAYSRLDNRVPWFRKLSDSEKTAILKLHQDGTPYSADDAVKLVRTPSVPSTQPATTTTIPPEDFDYSDTDSEEESDVDEVNRHWNRKSLKLLGKGFDFYEDSSDSEDEMGPKPDKEVVERRRKHKAGELEAIAKTAYPTSANEKTEFDELQDLRKKAFEDRPKKRGKYGKKAQKALMQRGRDMMKTNLGHNSYLRRAHREAVSEEQMKKGTSKLYNQKQGDVRKKLQNVMAEDHKKMKWEEKDFSSPQTWPVVKHMLSNVVSNDKKKKRVRKALDSKEDLTGTSHLGAFHHEAWKESFKSLGKPFEPHALNPLNLTLRHDERERKDDASIMPGAHEYDHQSAGFKKGLDWGDERSQGGGHFVDMDSEATYFILKGIGGKRKRKGEIYRPGKKQKTGPT
ncbi:MAG TPA: hypothetical protein VJ725_05030 [Thermoanaerobaculia bacterium]|nr:hypothetical protein [Thermoanaerobaculia bacterium]